ncbi:MAG: protease modulator HflC [Myxococcota bacterium]
MRRALVALAILAVGLVGLVFLGEQGIGPVVVTREGEQKLILLLGDPREEPTAPGLALRIPLLEEVRSFDARNLYLNVEPAQIPTRDEERIVVDNYVIWRIQDPLLFYRSFPTGTGQAESQIDRVVRSDVREVIGRHTVAAVVTDARVDIMGEITRASAEELARFGIEVLDVRINVTELPPATEQNVYARMRAERQRLARKHRAEGGEEARGIRADADRAALVLVAEATRESEILRGEGDAQSARIYADAYNTDPAFYTFVRSLEAYRKTIGEGTTLVLPPSHEFFRLFESIDGDGGAASQGRR